MIKVYRIIIILITVIGWFQSTAQIINQPGFAIYEADVKMLEGRINDHYFQPKEVTNKLLFTNQDIKTYDTLTCTFVLTESGQKKLSKLEIPLTGRPIIFAIDDEPLFGAWLWNGVSSHGCSWLVATIFPNHRALKFESGLPSTYFDDSYLRKLGGNPLKSIKLSQYFSVRNKLIIHEKRQ